MKNTNANELRKTLLDELIAFYRDKGEDVEMVNSNTANFPVSVGDEEGWVEIVVKVPKYDDEEGYGKREEYVLKCEEREAKAKEREKQKAEKIKKDKQKRLEKQLAREAEKAKAEKRKAVKEE